MKALLIALSLVFFGISAQANEEKNQQPAGDTAAATCSKAQEDHAGHKHGKKCGHKAVKHGDHTDYVHDGHKHMSHEDHYDECKG